MNDRPASWRMPSPKQFEKMAAEAARRRDPAAAPAPADPTPDELWTSLLGDPRAAGKPRQPMQQRRLSEIQRHVLRVECSRCSRIVEMQKVDAVRYFGADAIWKDVGQRMLDQTCPNRTGSHEDDGCWPSWSGSQQV